MNIAKFNYKNISKSRIIYLKHYFHLSLLKEEEKFINQIKKQRFANKISVTELDLSKKESVLKQFNSKHNSFNRKILNQIQTISKKVYINNPQDKRHELIHNILFIQPKKEIVINYNSPNKHIKLKSLNKISSPKRRSLNTKKEKDIIKENNSSSDKNYFNEIQTEKKKKILPPISFRCNVKKIKLNVNNNLNKSEEEKMMNLYKELEFQNRYKFVI